MCFNAKQQMYAALKRARYEGNEADVAYWREVLKRYDEWFMASGFRHPNFIIYDNIKPFEPKSSVWGLIPDWAETPESIWNNTLNARGETIFEKSSFRKSANEKRCLIPVDEFYDFHDFRGKKYPFYITRKNDEPLYFAGLWNEWTNKDSGEVLNIFSIVTTRANPLMSKIHNKPKFSNDPRMPVMLPENLLEEWLKPLSRKELQELATFQLSDSELDSWTVKPLSGKLSPGNVSEASDRFKYEDLEFGKNDDQLSLFK